MTGNEIKTVVTQLNAKVKNLNQQRQQNIGRKQELSKQIADTIAKYNAEYGTNITENDIESELEKVRATTEAEIAKLGGIIRAIESGDIKLANNMAGCEPADEVTSSQQKDVSVGHQAEVVNNTETAQAEGVSAPVMGVSPLTSPMNIDTGSIQGNTGAVSHQGFLANENPLPANTQQGMPEAPKLGDNPDSLFSGGVQGGSIFNKDFSANDEDDDDDIALAPPPSFSSILGGGM